MHFVWTTGCSAAPGGTWWKVAPHLHLLDHTGRPMGGFPRWSKAGNWRQPGGLAPHQTWRSHHPRAGAGKECQQDPKVCDKFTDRTLKCLTPACVCWVSQYSSSFVMIKESSHLPGITSSMTSLLYKVTLGLFFSTWNRLKKTNNAPATKATSKCNVK